VNEYVDAMDLFINAINDLKKGTISLHSPLEEVVLKTCGNNLAYVDDRKNAKEMYGYDLWAGLDRNWLEQQGIEKETFYSQSQQFPDFLFKVKKQEERYIGGALLELKDSKGGNIASFNSTLPTKYKNLEEVDVINNNNLLSKIARIKDGDLALDRSYFEFQRRCFYLVRTHKETGKVKLSIVDGSFFETVPKENLIYQMFLQVLRLHLEKKKIDIPQETLEKVEQTLSHITDQTIIASSRIIQNASIRPRLRIMAEVHPEGNPHGGFYPEITEGSINLILQSTPQTEKIKRELSSRVPEIAVFSIQHKRNGEHVVFQFSGKPRLTRYL